MKAVHVAVLATLATCFLATSVDALKCHVCEPDPNDADSCKATDFGVEQDGCTFCYVQEINEKQVLRLCSKDDDDSEMGCSVKDDLQFCLCNNTDYCNKAFKPYIQCYECDFEENPTSCYTDRLGDLKGGCLSCYSIKKSEKEWHRSCLKKYGSLDCVVIEGVHTCKCASDRCNSKDIILPTMKCYVCEPKSDSDKSCNWANSGSVQDGCLTCGRSFDKRKITTRKCIKDYAITENGWEEDEITYVDCGKDLCNGEGEEKVNDGKDENANDGKDENANESTTSRGLQKTVSSRLLIGAGIMTAMLGLARFF